MCCNHSAEKYTELLDAYTDIENKGEWILGSVLWTYSENEWYIDMVAKSIERKEYVCLSNLKEEYAKLILEIIDVLLYYDIDIMDINNVNIIDIIKYLPIVYGLNNEDTSVAYQYRDYMKGMGMYVVYSLCIPKNIEMYLNTNIIVTIAEEYCNECSELVCRKQMYNTMYIENETDRYAIIDKLIIPKVKYFLSYIVKSRNTKSARNTKFSL